ncbi:MAG: hypothetical protein ACI9CE_003278 [Flavobacterium sp.]
MPGIAATPSIEEILEAELTGSQNRLEEAQLRLSRQNESQQDQIAETEVAI